eukprot:scaffold2678_cov236-Ochromonas_danica.AAC.3
MVDYYPAIITVIDEVHGTATIAFSIGCSWVDKRFAMPLFWSKYHASSIQLTFIATNQSIVLFKPQLRYIDAKDLVCVDEDLTLSSKNMFLYKAACTITMIQTSLKFNNYPNDYQSLHLRVYAYPYDNTTAVMTIYNGVSFSTDEEGKPTFPQNQLWSYKGSYASVYNSGGSSSSTSIATFVINVQRKSAGIVLRLVVPVLFLVVLSTLTFWTVPDQRVSITITILLSVSALYIVIINNIPMVGYLTTVDRFIFAMFLVLVLVVVVHQIYSTLQEKQDRWPLRLVYLRILECAGRTVVLPFVTAYFVFAMPSALGDSPSHEALRKAIFAIVVAGSGIIFLRELTGLYAAWIRALTLLVAKINAKDTTFGVISFSPQFLIVVLQHREEMDLGFKQRLSLRQESIMRELRKSPSKSSTRHAEDGTRKRFWVESTEAGDIEASMLPPEEEKILEELNQEMGVVHWMPSKMNYIEKQSDEEKSGKDDAAD